LMRNTQTNSIDRAPGLGNVPILGALFRSTSYRKDETELVIIVTPVLVKPVNPNQIVLPTDGFKTASDLERVLLGRTQSGSSGGDRPKPISAPETTVIAPRVGAIEPLPQQQQSLSAPRRPKSSAGSPSAGSQGNAAAPGFSGN
jgi:pilus assembly protein CpaC